MCCDCETMVSGYIISCCLQRRRNSIPQCKKDAGRHTARFHQRALGSEQGQVGGEGVTTFLKHYPDAKQHTSGMTGGH